MNNGKSSGFALLPGTRLILLYVLLVYLVPSAFVALRDLSEIYRVVPLNSIALGVLVLAFITYLVLANTRIHSYQTPETRYGFQFLGTSSQITVLALLAAAGTAGFLEDLAGFRYGTEGIAERDSPILLVYLVVPTVLRFFLLVYLFYDRDFPTRRGIAQVLKKVLLVGALFLSANGIAAMLVACLGTVYVVFPLTVRNVVFKMTDVQKHTRSVRLRQRARLLVLLCILAALLPVGWILGEATKRGEIQTVLELAVSEGFLEWLINWGVGRSSPSYVSLLVALDHFALSLDWRVISEHLMAPLATFAYRANYLLLTLFEIARPQDGSISRINYIMIASDPFNPREGTSPGLFAGFLYSFPFPFNFLVLIGYLIFVQRFVGKLIAAVAGQLTVVGWIIFLGFMLPLFESPIDFLLILDDGVIALALFVLLRQVWIKHAWKGRVADGPMAASGESMGMGTGRPELAPRPL